jgi:hypothetical protein
MCQRHRRLKMMAVGTTPRRRRRFATLGTRLRDQKNCRTVAHHPQTGFATTRRAKSSKRRIGGQIASTLVAILLDDYHQSVRPEVRATAVDPSGSDRWNGAVTKTTTGSCNRRAAASSYSLRPLVDSGPAPRQGCHLHQSRGRMSHPPSLRMVAKEADEPHLHRRKEDRPATSLSVPMAISRRSPRRYRT